MKLGTKISAGVLALLMSASLLTGCVEKNVQDDVPADVTGETENNNTEDTGVRYNYDLSEYVELDFYKGIEIDKYTYGVTDEDVATQVLLARSNYAVAAEKMDAIAESDQVNIDFTGYMDGKEFEGGTAQGYDLTIGSGQFIEGFEAGLVGHKTGDTVTLDLHFPSPYPNAPELSGKPVQFVVKINKVFEQALPEYNDAFVKEHYDYDTVAEFEKAIHDSMVAYYEQGKLSYAVESVWNKIVAKTKILSYPEKEYNTMYDEHVNYYTTLATQEGISLNEYVKNEFGLAVETFYQQVQALVRSTMSQEMILYYVAQKENITISDEEYQTGAMAYAAQYGLSSVEELETYYTPENIAQSVLFDKVYEFLAENAVEVEPAENK